MLVLYIPWLRGVYQQYETRAPRYLPEAKPRADIEGRGSHIADTLREDMVYIICSIAYCNIKLHNCPPLLLGPFRLPPGSVLAPKKTNLSNRPFPPLFLKLGNGRVKPQAREGYLANNSEGSHFFSMCTLQWQ